MKYTVIGNIKHNGKLQKRGGQIDLDEADAARLVTNGFLAIVPASDAKAAKADTKSDKGAGK